MSVRFLQSAIALIGLELLFNILSVLIAPLGTLVIQRSKRKVTAGYSFGLVGVMYRLYTTPMPFFSVSPNSIV